MPLRRLFVALAALQLISAAEPVDNWAAQSFYFNWNELGVDPTVSVPQTGIILVPFRDLSTNLSNSTMRGYSPQLAACLGDHVGSTSSSLDLADHQFRPDYVPPFYLRVYTSSVLFFFDREDISDQAIAEHIPRHS
jgi:hypothetical protein